MTAHVLDVTEAEYHRDPCPEPSLSASIASVIVSQSPQHAWLKHPRLGAAKEEREEDEDSESTDQGTAVHSMLLGRGAKIVTVEAKKKDGTPVTDWRTDAAKAERDRIREAGGVPYLPHKFERLAKTVGILRTRLAKKGIVFDPSRTEVVLAWDAQTEAGPVGCRSMLDHVSQDWTQIDDLKTCRSAHPRDIQKAVTSYDYALAHAAYVRAVEALKPDLAGRVKMRFVFVECAPPYSVVIATLDAAMREIGIRRWERAAMTWGACLATGQWPGYQDVEVEAPAWLLAQDEADGMRE